MSNNGDIFYVFFARDTFKIVLESVWRSLLNRFSVFLLTDFPRQESLLAKLAPSPKRHASHMMEWVKKQAKDEKITQKPSFPSSFIPLGSFGPFRSIKLLGFVSDFLWSTKKRVFLYIAIHKIIWETKNRPSFPYSLPISLLEARWVTSPQNFTFFRPQTSSLLFMGRRITRFHSSSSLGFLWIF